MAERGSRNGAIDFLKFAFALLIVVYHMSGALRICYCGFVGVEFFFLVSGYLLAAKAARAGEGHVLDQNLAMLKGKVLRLFPYGLLALIASAVFSQLGQFSIDDLSNRLANSFGDIYGLQMLGFSGVAATGVAWYLSVLYFVSFLIYPILLKRRQWFTRYIAPITALCLLGYIAKRNGHYALSGEYWDIVYAGMLRGYVDMALGCVAYEVAQALNNSGESRSPLAGILEIGGYAAAFAYALFHRAPDFNDFYIVALLFASVTITFSNRSVLAHRFDRRLFHFLGEYSMSIFLNHFFVRLYLERTFPGISRRWLLLMYMGIVLTLALVNHLLGKRLARVIRTPRRMLAATLAVACAGLALAVPGKIITKIEHMRLKGSGTVESPYLIETLEDLQRLRDLVNRGDDMAGAYFLQTEDIDMAGEAWTPIGLYGSEKYFRGTYDGGNHTLSSLNIPESLEEDAGKVGLFGVLQGTVKNLGIASGQVTGSYVGAIASIGSNGARIINCYNRASVTGRGRAGGICDNLGDGQVINCVNFGKIKAPVAGEILSFDAAYVAAITPLKLPKTFSGQFRAVKMSGESAETLLNSGLNMLLRRGLLPEGEATLWPTT